MFSLFTKSQNHWAWKKPLRTGVQPVTNLQLVKLTRALSATYSGSLKWLTSKTLRLPQKSVLFAQFSCVLTLFFRSTEDSRRVTLKESQQTPLRNLQQQEQWLIHLLIPSPSSKDEEITTK